MDRLRSRPRRALLGAALVSMLLAGCASESGIGLHGQTAAQLEEDRAKCLPFVQAHTDAGADLAEAACLIARGYRAPISIAQGPSRIGYLYVDRRGEAPGMLTDFQACQVEAFKTPMPVIPDTNTSGIFSNLWAKLFPRGMTSKPPSPDDWVLKYFGACLTRHGYAVSGASRYP
ncbi:MAG TPA: hypothetical protein VMC04_11685 [Verrucomicrobiae bacterium]|nr:hypothetical protein [Verrucomicrobiae bacterium]